MALLKSLERKQSHGANIATPQGVVATTGDDLEWLSNYRNSLTIRENGGVEITAAEWVSLEKYWNSDHELTYMIDAWYKFNVNFEEMRITVISDEHSARMLDLNVESIDMLIHTLIDMRNEVVKYDDNH